MRAYSRRPGQGWSEARSRAGARGHCRAQADGARRGAAQAPGGQGEEDVLEDVQLRTARRLPTGQAWHCRSARRFLLVSEMSERAKRVGGAAWGAVGRSLNCARPRDGSCVNVKCPPDMVARPLATCARDSLRPALYSHAHTYFKVTYTPGSSTSPTVSQKESPQPFNFTVRLYTIYCKVIYFRGEPVHVVHAWLQCGKAVYPPSRRP